MLDRAQGGSVELVGALFILPFILFSPFAGYLADRFPKSLLLQATKVAELLILAAGSYFLVHEQQLGLLLCLFLLGCHSALFSPAKYGLLPELLPEEELSRANGLLELWTFLPIILGTILGGLLVTLGEDRSLISAALLLSCSALGTAASFFIPRSQSLNPQAKLVLNPLRSLRDSLAEIGTQRELFSVILATCFFWFVGQVFQLNVPLFSKQVLLLESFETSLLLATLAIGIGLGSFFAGRVSAGKVELGLVPLGAGGLGIGALALGIEPTSAWVAALLLFIAGISGGLFIIPLNSYVQAKSPASKRGQYIATSNVLQYSAMLLATGGMWFVLKVLALSPKTLFLGVGVMSVTLAVLISVYMPRMFIRCLNWLITHLVYRVRSAGLERIPKEGGALLVCNHVSYVDPSILMASCERPIRFLMYRPIYEAVSYTHLTLPTNREV
mgnify:CR=1 FL=1